MNSDKILNRMIKSTFRFLEKSKNTSRMEFKSEKLLFDLRFKINRFWCGRYYSCIVIEAIEIKKPYQNQGIGTKYFALLPKIVAKYYHFFRIESVSSKKLVRILKKLGYKGEMFCNFDYGHSI